MKISQLVHIVEKNTGAMFCGDSLIPMPDDMLDRAQASVVDKFWTHFFATCTITDANGDIIPESIEYIQEELHRIAREANTLALALRVEEKFVRISNTSEIACEAEVM